MTRSGLGKLVALGGVVVVLLLGLSSIGSLVDERRARQLEAERSVAESLAGEQTVLSPVLKRQCTEKWEEETGEGKTRRKTQESRDVTLMAWPKRVEVKAQLGIEPRYRGLFKVNTYAAKADLKAEWPDLLALQGQAVHKGGQLVCATPTVSLAMTDARGIRAATLRQGEQALTPKPGALLNNWEQGLHADLVSTDAAQPMALDITLTLAGTKHLAWVPMGGETLVTLEGDWPHPSFDGRYLPVQREVRDNGFRAQWQVNGLAIGTAQDQAATFGVGFIDPVNPHVLSDRALKYGLLFIGLTFVGVGLMEVMKRLRVHPVQYALVGCALTIFFMLLLSLSEHLPFGWAYGVAASACSALLAYYGAHLLQGWRPGLAFGALIGLLYGALYALLQLEQTALVLGSILLFAVLSATMVATRRLDWYSLGASLGMQVGTASQPK